MELIKMMNSTFLSPFLIMYLRFLFRVFITVMVMGWRAGGGEDIIKMVSCASRKCWKGGQ